MRALVTGGHGFLGSHLVDRLLAEGAGVRALVRRPGRPAAFEGSAVEVVRGDIRDAAALRTAVRDVDAVYHLAGLTRALSRRQMFQTNVGGTQALLEALVATGFQGRLVLCSSLSAVGRSPDGTPLDETSPPLPMTAYGESKLQAERLILGCQRSFSTVVLRPPGVYGPRDSDFLSLFQSVARGFAPVIGSLDHRFSLVHAQDVAAAFLAVARAPGAAGQVYMVAHRHAVTQAQIVDAAERAVGRRARRIVLPPPFIRLLGATVDLGSQLTGRASILGGERVRELSAAHWVCSSAALERDTGWAAEIDLERGFAETAAWYRDHGRLSDKARDR